ncbi:MAG: rod shape-determining protein MreC [Tepidisphaeraceae bacterium]
MRVDVAAGANGVREASQLLFVPVAGPVRMIGRWAGDRVSPTVEVDPLSPNKPRNAAEVYRQNAVLITQLENLRAQFDDLKQLSAQYRDLDADLQRRVHPAAVQGGSATNRQTLQISAASVKNVRERLPVIHPAGFVGQIYGVAAGGATARVLLATDPESKLVARFVRFETTDDGAVRGRTLRLPPPLVEGAGPNLMVVRGIPARDVRAAVQAGGFAVGDWALLDDPSMPLSVKAIRLGRVSKITLPATDAGHAVIELTPTTDFNRLRKVLVVDR